MNKIRIESPDVQAFETQHTAAVRRLAPECMVLLKNDGTLPLQGTGSLRYTGAVREIRSRVARVQEM